MRKEILDRQGAALVDGDVITHVSDGLCSLLGLPPDQILGRSLASFLSPGGLGEVVGLRMASGEWLPARVELGQMGTFTRVVFTVAPVPSRPRPRRPTALRLADRAYAGIVAQS